GDAPRVALGAARRARGRSPARARRASGRAAARAGRRSREPVIYLDTSVALAHLLAEDRSPPPSLWDETLVSSRLLEYEMWNRLHARRLVTSQCVRSTRCTLRRSSFFESNGRMSRSRVTTFGCLALRESWASPYLGCRAG